jgi:serine/threonine protein kinase
VKLCDFGSATMLSGGPGSTIPLWDVCGTIPFSAPEMLTFRGYGTRVDMWAFGVLAYVLLFGQYPYMPRPFTLENMRTSIQEDRPKVTYKPRSGLIHRHITPSTISFVEAFLNRDPSARASAHKALKMDWLRPAHRSKGSSTKLVQEPHMIPLDAVIQSAKKLGALGRAS